MQERTKKRLGQAAFSLASLGTLGLAYWWRKQHRARRAAHAVTLWARPGMEVTFRAELMPRRDREARTYRISDVLPTQRVRLADFPGEHSRDEFEPANPI